MTRTIDYSRADRVHAKVLNAELDAQFEQAMARDEWRNQYIKLRDRVRAAAAKQAAQQAQGGG